MKLNKSTPCAFVFALQTVKVPARRAQICRTGLHPVGTGYKPVLRCWVVTNSSLMLFAAVAIASVIAPPLAAQQTRTPPEFATSLTFYASFDEGVKADYAKGNPQLYTVVETQPQPVAKPGLHAEATSIQPGVGLSGGALRFTMKDAKRVFYKAPGNLSYQHARWEGTVSLWLRLDPEEDLEPGYCDPIQITPRKWNDAAFFVDFDKDGDPRDFRLGAFSDFAIWNPQNKPLGEIPNSARPLLPVKNPPFGRDKWTHVAFTWKDFNRDGTAAQAVFYLDGKRQGSIADRHQQFTWRPNEDCRIQIGINYIGLFDELACFGRALEDQEIGQLYRLRGGLRAAVAAVER